MSSATIMPKSAVLQAAKRVDESFSEMERGIGAVLDATGENFVERELKDKAKLFAQRHALYGDNYKRFGPIFSLLIDTQKIDPHSSHDMSRLGILVQIVSKVTRYAENFNRGGHDDSLDDIAVYAMMLKDLDRKN